MGKSKLCEMTISPTVSSLFLESQRWAYDSVGSGRLLFVLFSSFCVGVSLQLLVVGLYLLEHGINAGRLCAHPRKSEDGGAEYEKSFIHCLTF